MRGLLQRLVVPSTGRHNDVQDIVDHLRVLLNTHTGDGHCAPDFGVDLHSLLVRWPASRNEIIRGIEDTISRYETRLRDIHVEIAEGQRNDMLVVTIRARVPNNEELTLRAALTRGRGLGLRVGDDHELS